MSNSKTHHTFYNCTKFSVLLILPNDASYRQAQSIFKPATPLPKPGIDAPTVTL